MIEISVDKLSVYKYLGYNDSMQKISNELEKQVDECINEVKNVATFRAVQSKKLDITNFNPVSVEGIIFGGEDIKKHLKNCTQVVLIAVTLGSEIDKLLKKYELINITKAVICDAVCNIIIEQFADICGQNIQKTIENDGKFATSRFSPGYGDLPLDCQKRLLNKLDAEKKVGITLTDTNLMIPKKSITAIMGVSSVKVTGKLAGCNSCLLKGKCELKKRGLTCVK